MRDVRRPSPRLIIFDLDGTLVDSRRDIAESANRMIVGFGGAPLPESEIVSMVGEGARVLVERALEAARLDVPVDAALEHYLAIYDRHLLDWTRPYEGVPELVERVRCPMAVLTNKPEPPSRRLVEAFGLASRFRMIVGGGGRWPRKPQPEGLLAIAADVGVEPGEAWMVGDSHIDLEAARAAGTHFVLAAYGFGADSVSDLPACADRIDRPLDLLRLIEA